MSISTQYSWNCLKIVQNEFNWTIWIILILQDRQRTFLFLWLHLLSFKAALKWRPRLNSVNFYYIYNIIQYIIIITLVKKPYTTDILMALPKEISALYSVSYPSPPSFFSAGCHREIIPDCMQKTQISWREVPIFHDVQMRLFMHLQ